MFHQYGIRKNVQGYGLICCTFPQFAEGTKENYKEYVIVAGVPAETWTKNPLTTSQKHYWYRQLAQNLKYPLPEKVSWNIDLFSPNNRDPVALKESFGNNWSQTTKKMAPAI